MSRSSTGAPPGNEAQSFAASSETVIPLDKGRSGGNSHPGAMPVLEIATTHGISRAIGEEAINGLVRDRLHQLIADWLKIATQAAKVVVVAAILAFGARFAIGLLFGSIGDMDVAAVLRHWLWPPAN